MQTVHEMQQRWCPFARTSVTMESDKGKQVLPGGFNRWEGGGMTACIGARCALWVSEGKYSDVPVAKQVVKAGEEKKIDEPGYKVETKPIEDGEVVVKLYPEYGHCGMRRE